MKLINKFFVVGNMCGALLIFSSNASSASVRVDFSAEVKFIEGGSTDNTVMPGDIVNGYFTFDYIVTPIDIIDRFSGGFSTISGYLSAPSSFHLENNGVTLQSWVVDETRQPTDPDYFSTELDVLNGTNGFQDLVAFSFLYRIPNSGFNQAILTLVSQDGDLLTSTALPNPFPEAGWLYKGDLTGSTLSAFNGGTGGGRFNATVNFVSVTTVPVPAAVWLFGSGLLGLVGLARRKA